LTPGIRPKEWIKRKKAVHPARKYPKIWSDAVAAAPSFTAVSSVSVGIGLYTKPSVLILVKSENDFGKMFCCQYKEKFIDFDSLFILTWNVT
jgi:hypothetical protein